MRRSATAAAPASTGRRWLTGWPPHQPSAGSVTVLFADAHGSTALTERIGDEEAYALIQECMTAMTEAVERHDGTVTQFRGDGIMALFGAPVAHEDATVRAVTAGLEMQAALKVHACEVEVHLGEAPSFRIGIHTGPVVVGGIGDTTLVDYTAIGDTANLAARLEQAATPGEVLLSDTTWRAVRDFVVCEEAATITVKGRSRPVTTWRAVERRPLGSRIDAAAIGGLTRLVGRQHHLAVLLELADDLRAGSGRVALVGGEPGIGKSRLLWELRAALASVIDWVQGRCSSAERPPPWLPVVELLRGALGLEADDPPAPVRARIDETAERWPPSAQGEVAHLRWVLGVGDDDPGVEPRARRAGVVEAVRVVVRSMAARRPLVVAVEDLHWADEASQAVAAALAELADNPDVPVLVVLTHRPDHRPVLADGAAPSRCHWPSSVPATSASSPRACWTRRWAIGLGRCSPSGPGETRSSSSSSRRRWVSRECSAPSTAAWS